MISGERRKRIKKLIRAATEYDIVKFAIAKALKRQSGYSLTICKDGIVISKADLYNSYAPVEDVALSEANENIVNSLIDEPISLVSKTTCYSLYISLFNQSVDMCVWQDQTVG